MSLDEPLLGAAQIGELALTDIVNIRTWTTRGFADPYHTRPPHPPGRRTGAILFNPRCFTVLPAFTSAVCDRR
jgi:hypothetical protein